MKRRLSYFTAVSLIFAVGGALKLAAQVEATGVESVDILHNGEKKLMESGRDLTNLIAEVERKAEELKRRDEIISATEARQREVSLEIGKKIDELTVAEDRLREALGQAKESANKDVEIVVSLYEKMKPKQAASTFEMMDPALASGLLSKMNAEVASSILANLSSEKAYAISVYLSGRNVR